MQIDFRWGFVQKHLLYSGVPFDFPNVIGSVLCACGRTERDGASLKSICLTWQKPQKRLYENWVVSTLMSQP
jgi:hypothetical protein